MREGEDTPSDGDEEAAADSAASQRLLQRQAAADAARSTAEPTNAMNASSGRSGPGELAPPPEPMDVAETGNEKQLAKVAPFPQWMGGRLGGSLNSRGPLFAGLRAFLSPSPDGAEEAGEPEAAMEADDGE